jgi:hypothetical protein
MTPAPFPLAFFVEVQWLRGNNSLGFCATREGKSINTKKGLKKVPKSTRYVVKKDADGFQARGCHHDSGWQHPRCAFRTPCACLHAVTFAQSMCRGALVRKNVVHSARLEFEAVLKVCHALSRIYARMILSAGVTNIVCRRKSRERCQVASGACHPDAVRLLFADRTYV